MRSNQHSEIQSFVSRHKFILCGCVVVACVETPAGLPNEETSDGTGGKLHDVEPGDGDDAPILGGAGGELTQGMGGGGQLDDPTLERCFYAGVETTMGGAAGEAVSVSSHAFLGEVLVQGDGLALYTYGGDRPGTCNEPPLSGCAADCAIAWPPFLSEGPLLGEGLEASDFGVFEREDGGFQSTYRGWPLYRYLKDEAAGDVKGQGKGSIWHAASPRVTEIAILRNGDNQKYLVDQYGFTFYVLAFDEQGNDDEDPVSLCRDDCRDSFVPFRGNHLTVATSLNATEFQVFTSPGVGRQVAYRGMPLYLHVGDTSPLDTNGLDDADAALALF